MLPPTSPIDQANQFIRAGQFQHAEFLLDAMVRVNPRDLNAWKSYVLMYHLRGDLEWSLEWLMGRILRIRELTDADKAEISAYRDQILNSEGREVRTDPAARPAAPVQENAVTLELVEEIELAPKLTPTEKQPRAPFLFDIPPLALEFAGLLVLLFFAARFLSMSYLTGFLLLAIFLVAGAYWAWQAWEEWPRTPVNTTHAYALENRRKLEVVRKGPKPVNGSVKRERTVKKEE